jgi:hypothetical protein
LGPVKTLTSHPPSSFEFLDPPVSRDLPVLRCRFMETFDPPKYIMSLAAAVNDGAKSAQLGALAFTAIGLFLLATAFSATDEDLLLNRALTISQLGGTAVPVVFAF